MFYKQHIKNTKDLGTNSMFQGFTLIELLVVIAIISLLSSVILAGLQEARIRARDTAISESLLSLKNNVENYYTSGLSYEGMCDVGSTVRDHFEQINNNFGYGTTYGTDYECILISYQTFLFFMKVDPTHYRCFDSSGIQLNLFKLFEGGEAPEGFCPTS